MDRRLSWPIFREVSGGDPGEAIVALSHLAGSLTAASAQTQPRLVD
jgi:hypothetical protein